MHKFIMSIDTFFLYSTELFLIQTWYEVLVWSTGMKYEVRTTNLEVRASRNPHSKSELENKRLSEKIELSV